MKDALDAILKRPQAEYLDSILPQRDSLLAEMEEFAAKNGHPIADPEVAQLMRIVVRLRHPEHVLEIGTNIGYSVVVIGREVDAAATIDTIELDRQTLATAREFVARATLGCRVNFHQGAALEVLPTLGGPWDLVFIDCVKSEYGDYLDAVLPKLRPGAVIVCDNLLWKGQVATHPYSEREIESTDAIREFNKRISTDPRLLTTIVAVGDGVGISVVNRRPA